MKINYKNVYNNDDDDEDDAVITNISQNKKEIFALTFYRNMFILFENTHTYSTNTSKRGDLKNYQRKLSSFSCCCYY